MDLNRVEKAEEGAMCACGERQTRSPLGIIIVVIYLHRQFDLFLFLFFISFIYIERLRV